METDRISSLHTSCLGFAPLIFDLKESEGRRVSFDQLMNACDPVWKAVETDEMLSKKLVKNIGISNVFSALFQSVLFAFTYFNFIKTCFTKFGIPLFAVQS